MLRQTSKEIHRISRVIMNDSGTRSGNWNTRCTFVIRRDVFMESLNHFGVAVDFEKDIAFVPMLITAKDPKQAPVLIEIIGEVINFGNVIICAPC